MIVFDDVRRWAALRYVALSRLLLGVEAHLEDARGAVSSTPLDREYAAFVGRLAVLDLLSIRSLATGGEIDYDGSSVSFDFFHGLPDEEVRRALELGVRPISESWSDQDAESWIAALSALRAEVAISVGLPDPLPEIRTSDGMFPALALARDYLRLCSEVGVPIRALLRL